MKKKLIIMFLCIISLIMVLPSSVHAMENINDKGMYILADKTTKKITTKSTKKSTTTSSLVSEDEAEKIVGNASSMCQEGSGLKKFFRMYWNIVAIFAPALLILMTSVDFFQAITSSDADRLKKSANSAFKRALAFVLLLLLPFILNTVFGWFGLSLCL